MDWNEIVSFVDAYIPAVAANPNRQTYLIHANAAMADIATRTHCHVKEWRRGADFEVERNLIIVPEDLLTVKDVLCGSAPLRDMTAASNQTVRWGPDITGRPHAYIMRDGSTIALSSVPPDETDIRIVGAGLFPKLKGDSTDKEILKLIPMGSQNMIAYYIITSLPLVAEIPTGANSLSASIAQMRMREIEKQQQKFAAKYEEAVAMIIANMNRRRSSPFKYG